MPGSVGRNSSFQNVAIGIVAASVVGLYVLGLSGGGQAPAVAAATAVSDLPAPQPPAVQSVAAAVSVVSVATLSSGIPAAEPALPTRAFVREASFAKSADVLLVGSAGKLSALFKRIGYELEGVRRKGEVPRLFIASLPPDLVKLPRPAVRKVMFIKSTLPLVLHVNELILQDRERLIQLRDQAGHGISLSETDRRWLERLASLHGVEIPESTEAIDFAELLVRIDVIPPSLAIAQAAEESGWGTSRFAREGNALFGQRIFGDARPGIVPRDREEGMSFKVRAFDHLIDGVKAYSRNLNSHFAYERFRDLRAEMRGSGETIDGRRLAATLDRYSERGHDYVETIRTIMRVNGLDVFDGARLGDRIVADLSPPDA